MYTGNFVINICRSSGFSNSMAFTHLRDTNVMRPEIRKKNQCSNAKVAKAASFHIRPLFLLNKLSLSLTNEQPHFHSQGC